METSSVTCEIKLNKFPENIYFSGEQINGNITLILSKHQLILGVYVKLIEKAHCEFSIGKDYNTLNLHTGNERISIAQKYLVGCFGSTTKLLIRSGTYLYQFQFDIPLEIPSSTKAENGYVQYFILVCINYSSLPKQEFIKYFTIKKKLDLNIFPVLRNSYSREKSITFYDFCCIGFCSQTDPLTINVHIPVTGYVPGEIIIITLKIKNHSVDMQRFLIQIVKIIDFYAINTGLSKVRAEIIVAEKRIGGVRVGHYQTFNNYVIVPKDVTSTDLNSSISNACCIKLPKFDIPITIGTESLNVMIPLPSTSPSAQQSVIVSSQPMPSAPILPHQQEEEYESNTNSLLNGQPLTDIETAQPSDTSIIIVRQPMPSSIIPIRYNYDEALLSDLPTYEEAVRLPTTFRSPH